jgi:hypothetical protein
MGKIGLNYEAFLDIVQILQNFNTVNDLFLIFSILVNTKTSLKQTATFK